MSDILYCFISHKSVFNQDAQIISDMFHNLDIKDYLIIRGHSKTDYIDNDHMLYLKCDDTYEGLPDKTHKMCKYITTNFPQYSYYAKLDRLTRVQKPISSEDMTGDYCGSWVKVKEGFDGNRKWHFGKCSENSEWANKLYPGKFIPWCNGWGYFLSNKAAKIVASHPPRLDYHIYEDLYVSETLLDYGNIVPKHIKNLKELIIDSEFTVK